MRFPITSKQHFLFDLDGTLVNSNEFHEFAFRQVLERSAPQHLAGFDYETVKGHATRAVFEAFGFNDEAEVNLLTAEKQSAYSSAIARNGLPLIRGAKEILELLSSLNRKMYIVSAGSRRSVEEALRAAQIRSYFADVITSDDVKRSKPEPEIYLKCISKNNLSAGDCIAVEDSDSGVAASTAAGIDTVMVGCTAAATAGFDSYSSLEEFSLKVIENFGVHR